MAEKQVRVDNWGIFLLQRLQHFFNRTDFCDLTLQFENNVQLKVHRLVVNACTEYFQMLEQSCEFIDDCLIMPDDLQPDVVLPIVNFMYTGQLEYRSSNFDKLYATAELMNMTVLTKLLDAQKNPISPLPKPLNKKASPIPVTWNLQGKKIVPKTMDPDLPEPLPGRKLPIWKRKNVPGSNYRPFDVKRHIGEVVPLIKPFSSISVDNTPRPTRFELPEDDSAQIIFESSFDDISYESKPLATPVKEESGIVSPTFEDIKKASMKRLYSEISSDSKRVNLQEVKEYLQEHRLRTDYMINDDSTVTQNEYDYFSDDNNSNSQSKNSECIFGTPSKSILKSSDDGQSQSKRVRFNFEDKENTDGSKPTAKVIGSKIKTTIESPSALNHAKIISEVLKKYPHLVKKNKNIKLKIMQKNTTSPGPHPIQLTKAGSKVSYVVRKPEKQQAPQDNEVTTVWECHACSATMNSRMYFDSHYEYRKHLYEVHNEKIDLKVCEHCGYKSAKNNLLMYHLQTAHNIKPPTKYRFPQCDRCDYVAVTDSMLVKHKATTHTDEIVCKECKSVLADCHAFVKHSYVENHNTNMQFDCKYCPKKFWRPVNILKHMRTYHKTEYSQHGFDDIVLEQAVPNETAGEKIQILSNVKLEKQSAENQIISNIQNLEPSSEAEALSNVASGIAASLGLVDTIVVLDDNQFVLHPTEEIHTQQAPKQEQFIVPDLRDETISNFNTQNNLSEQSAIISEANIIANSGITSTDELVMVLTDHDYGDGNEQIITGDNSNIVVLYSHPVDGQQTQYISQQGNIILNPQTGMLEMAGNQIHVTTSEALSMDTHTNSNLVQFKNEPEESIEMIQREINSHVEQTAQFISEDVEVQQTQSEEMTDTIVETESNQRPLEMPDLSEPACANEEHNDAEMPILNDERTEVEMGVQQTEDLNEKTNTEDDATEIMEEIEQNIPENQESEEIGQNHENQENEEHHETQEYEENHETQEYEEHHETQENEEHHEIQENEEHHEIQENEEHHEIQENEEHHESQENDNDDSQENDEQVEQESIQDATESILRESQITSEEENNQSTENVSAGLNKDEHDSSICEPAEIVVMSPEEIAGMASAGIGPIGNFVEPMEIDEPYETLLEDSKTDDSVNEENLESSNTSVEVERPTDNSQTEAEEQDNNTQTENEIEQKEVNDEPMEVDSRLTDDIGRDEVDHELQNVEQDVEELTESTENTNRVSKTEKVDESVEEEKLDDAPSQTVQSEKEVPGDELPYEDNTNDKDSKNAVEEEEEPKGEKSNDNVTALVSDWCDEDSGLLSADRESATVEEQQPQRKPSEKPVRKGPHGKASNPKITKLLDDWDDGDTDSQHSGVDSNQKPANESQIDNLIDDWDDDE